MQTLLLYSWELLDKKLKNPIVNFFESPSFTSMFSPLYADFFIDFAWKVCKQFCCTVYPLRD